MKSKTYDPERAKGKKKNAPDPDGHDDGAGGHPREDQGEGVPFWYIDDPQGDLPDDVVKEKE
jgi:hypothetical protein